MSLRRSRAAILVASKEVLYEADYRVVRMDAVSSVADVLTISLAAEPELRPLTFLRVVDLDWPVPLANLAEPGVTRIDLDAAMLAHGMLLATARDMTDRSAWRARRYR